MAKRVVVFLNQFFGQIGGEEMASVGFSVKDEPIGPAVAMKMNLGDEFEVVGTVIAGDEYFAAAPDKTAEEEGLPLVEPFKPDLFLAGPAFAAGRYTVSCGAMCKAVSKALGIPVITAMDPDAPGVDIYKKDVYIVKTGNNAREMPKTVKKMCALAKYLCAEHTEKSNMFSLQYLPDPAEFDYIKMDRLYNIFTEETVAKRSVDKLLQKVRGEKYETEVEPDRFETFPAPEAIKDMSKCRIAFASDGGLVPKGNPDKMLTRSNLKWKAYDIESLYKDYEVAHAGYFNDYVLEDPNRLAPLNILKEFVAEGKLGGVSDLFYSMPACTTVSKQGTANGIEMAKMMKERGDVDAVILTSTWGTSTRCGSTISKEIERAGIPLVQITAIPNIAEMLGVYRVLVGKAVPHPCGDPKLPPEDEHKLMRKYMEKALEMLQTEIVDDKPITVILE